LSFTVKLFSWLQKFVVLCISNRFATRLYEWILWNQVKNGVMPRHIGVILDGNRRWALSKGLNPWDGHVEGVKKAEDLLEWCREIGKITTVTLYVFSIENFLRAKDEVQGVMDIVESSVQSLIMDKRIHSNRIRVKVIGRTAMLPPGLQRSIEKLEEATANYDQSYLNLAIAYGGRAEIVDALRQIAQDVKGGNLSPTDLDEKVIEEHLYTSFLPNPHPDLIVRTSGEERLSNFLLWQSAYSEFCFLDVYWPSFKKYDLLRAIRVYQERSRRYGG
jgi:tritrans,polycis-undecaprenyl-diphosphate synthase [geranylgeranyl-diphosphate specific]